MHPVRSTMAALLMSTLLAPTAAAAPAGEPPVQLAFFFGSGDMNEAEKELKEGHAEDAAETLHAVYEGIKATMKPEERERLLKLRADIARGGGNIKTFADWDNDGLDLGKGAKYVTAIESKFPRMDGQLKNSQHQSVEHEVDAIRQIFARPEFAASPALIHYRDHFAEPRLHKYMLKLCAYWAKDLEHNVGWAKTAIGRGDYDSTMRNVEQARNLYKKLKAAAYDTSAHLFKLDDKDELADDVSIDQAMKQLNEWLARSKTLAAKSQADRAAKHAAFKKALKADKLKTFTERGEPDNWPGGWELTDVARAEYWSYYEPASQYYRWMTTYYFDGQHKLLKKDRRLIFSP